MDEQLCLLAVHAHPDDESSKGPATIARYHADGVRTVLVCATGGEAGDILNPAMDRPGVKERLPELRREELATAAALIGYDEVVMLGYRDSGMPGTPTNQDPRSFAQAPLEEAIGRLVEVVRRERPQVLITYGTNQRGYPHPDHLRTHDVSVAAFELAGDPDAYPGTGDPWQPLKLYYTVWSRARMVAMHEKFLELGMESPFSPESLERFPNEDGSTTRIDIEPWADVRTEALLAHRTQVDPTSRRWFGLPREVARSVHPYDEYQLARDLTGSRLGEGELEDDLFAGIREPVDS